MAIDRARMTMKEWVALAKAWKQSQTRYKVGRCMKMWDSKLLKLCYNIYIVPPLVPQQVKENVSKLIVGNCMNGEQMN